MKNKIFLAVTYKHECSTYTDILSIEELNHPIGKEWINKITKVANIKDPKKALLKDAAQGLIKAISQSKNPYNEAIQAFNI